MNNSNNKWLTENPLFKPKENKYYYDFGTGIKIKKDGVKKEFDPFLEGFNSDSTEANKWTSNLFKERTT